MAKPWIVKLGGSLANSPAQLTSWLQLLSDHGAGRVIIVPGGGQFADAVRQAQQQWQFDDASAHHMALLAMVQYGLMLGGIKDNFVPVDELKPLHKALASKQIPVWLPVPMALQDNTLEASWRVTSDSLALWLAARVQAECVILLKSVAIANTEIDIQQMVNDEIVDALFYHYSKQYRGAIAYLGPDQQEALSQALIHDTYQNLNIIKQPEENHYGGPTRR